MIVEYDKETGEILTVVKGDGENLEFDNPTVELPKQQTEKKKIDTETKSLVWDISLSEAQSLKINEIKDEANNVLIETDWYVTRKQETGESIPQSVIDHRAEVRSLSDQFESEVNNFNSVSDVLDYSFSYPNPPEP